MKTRTLFFTLLFSIAAFTSQAQFSFGIKGSLTNAWQEYGDDFGGNGANLKVNGVSSSVMIYYRLSNLISVGVEPGLAKRGATCEPGFFIENPYLTGDATLHANYIQIPLLARISKGLVNNLLEVSVKVGSSASWLASGYRELDLEWEPGPNVQDINFEEETNLKRWETGINAGAGLGVRIGPGKVLMEYEYYHGMIDMNRQITSKNRTTNYSVGYWVDF